MPITRYPANRVQFDKTAMTPFQAVDASATLQTTYTTLQSITGRGYLDTAVLNSSIAISGSLRITVDGVVRFEGSTAASSAGITGVLKRELIIPIGSVTSVGLIRPSDSSTTVAFIAGAVVAYPYTANAVSSVTAIAVDSIYFFSSLLIEAKSGTAATAHKYYFSGGFQ